MAKQQMTIHIPKPREDTLTLHIRGVEPLLVHRLGKKLREQMENDKPGQTRRKQPKPSDEERFLDSLYFLDKYGREAIPTPEKITKTSVFGFPASGLKKAMVSACRQIDGVKMTEIRGRFFVVGRYIRIEGTPTMDKPWVRIGSKGPGTGTPAVGVRARFDEWSADVVIRYFPDLITPESVANLLSWAGSCDGIGEDRPNKSGNSFGTWVVC